MTTQTVLRRASFALMAFTFAACGDSTGPSATLTKEQVGDMLDAMSAVSAFGGAGGAGFAVTTVSATVDCPNGGKATATSTINDNQTTGSATVQVTQSFSGCKATSSGGRVWTFDGNPNIVTNVSLTSNQMTGAFTMTATQKGGIKFTSDLGSGGCAIDLSMSLTGNATSLSGSVTGTACGQTINQTISIAP